MKNNGFTLIELLLVIGLISVLSAVLSYNVMDILERNQADAVAKQLAMDIRYAQQKAVEESRDWVMAFTDGAEDSYRIYPAAESSKPRTVIAISGNSMRWGDEEGNYLPADLTFTPAGGITGTVNQFAVSNDDGNEIYIHVDSVTGRVTLLAAPIT